MTARFKAGKATVGEMVSARREYDAAQEGIEQAAQRESVSWRRSTRR